MAHNVRGCFWESGVIWLEGNPADAEIILSETSFGFIEAGVEDYGQVCMPVLLGFKGELGP